MTCWDKNRTIKIAVVEDDPLDVEILIGYLSRIDEFEVDLAVFNEWTDADNSLDGMDLVMLDYYLGKHTALDIVQQIRSRDNKIPVIILTGNEDVHTAALISRNGADDYLVKGRLDINQLTKSICNVMERHCLRRERNELKEQMYALQRLEAMGSLAGGIAHDFNNILFPITGYAEMLLMDAGENKNLKKGLNEILKGAERAKELIRQILTFSSQGKQSVAPLRAHLVVNEALKLMRSTLPSTIHVRSSIDKENDLVMADSTQIHQIIMNLMTNAYHATEKSGGEILVSLKPEDVNGVLPDGQEIIPGNYVHLCVRDTGEGISKDVMKRVFDPYFTTKPEGKGTGLGLAVVLGIVKNSHGYILLESEPGKGTAVHIYIPLLEKQINAKFLVEERSVYTGSGHILLVDDQLPIIRMEKLMLERMGYRVTTMTNSRDALELFRKSPDRFDLVLTDFTMPGMTGEQMACAMISIRSDIPIVICTGFSENITEKKALQLGMRALLMKPVVQSDLSLTLHKILYSKSTPAEKY
ncbi:MAG: response regulator [Desulfamplus sp.]|nr:response regulator [Desulfamplus sp.]